MEDKELNQFRDTKPHNNKEIFTDLWETNMTVHEISQLLHISVKLVHIKLKEYGLR